MDVTQGAKNRKTSYETALVTDAWTRTVTGPDQSKAVLSDKGHVMTLVSADGTKQLVTFDLDIYFGGQAKVLGDVTVRLPSGKELEIENSLNGRSMSNAQNPLDFRDWTDLVGANGNLHESKYDRATRTWRHTSPMGRVSLVTLDEKAHPTISRAAGIATTELAYEAGRVETMMSTADSETRQGSFGYDAQGWPAFFTNELGERVEYDFDIAGRLRGLTRPDQEKAVWELNNANQVVTVTPPGSKSHVFDYDASTKLLKTIEPPAITTAGAGVVRFDYDAKAHELTKITRADGRSIAFEYDGAGRVSAQRFGAASINFHYTAGHLTRIDRTDGVTVDQSFDGPLWMGTQWTGGVQGNVKASYDENLWLSSLTVNDQSTVRFTYDDDGLLLSAMATVGGIALSRDAATGNVTATKLGNTTSKYAFSGFGELSHTSVAHSGATLFEQTIVDRDALGRIVHLTESVQGTLHEVTYEYDAAGRLMKQTRDGVATSYGYDANGNRLSITVGSAGAVTATYDAQDRIQNYGATTYEHDAHGDLELRSEGSKSLATKYDELGNLMQAIVTDGGTTQTIKYLVDGLGRRVGRQVNGVTDRVWLYRDALRPIAEIDGAGVFTHFIYGSNGPLSGAPVAMIRGGVPYRIVTDHLGSVRLVVNAQTGAVVQSIDYDAFGRVLSQTGASFQPFGFAGGLNDATTGLVRFGARDYDPETGRWTNKDPIGFAGQQGNVYLYVGGDPVNGVDPEGRHPVALGIAAGAGVLLATSDREAFFAAAGAVVGSLIGPALGAVGRFLSPAGRVVPRTIRLGPVRWDAMASTDKFGNITLRRGLTSAERSTSLRHELVHRFFSPQAGTPLAEVRANFGVWGYKNSQLLRYTEEALAEGIATGSFRTGLVYPFLGGYELTVGGVCLEGGIYLGAVGGTMYVVGSK